MDKIPVWVIDDSSGAADGEPSDWASREDDQGVFWVRTGLVSFGRANALYRELLARVDDIELAGEPQFAQAAFVGGLKSLPIRYRMK